LCYIYPKYQIQISRNLQDLTEKGVKKVQGGRWLKMAFLRPWWERLDFANPELQAFTLGFM